MGVKSNVFVPGWWDRVNFSKLTNDTKMESRAGRGSEPGNILNLTSQGSEQPDQNLELALVWAGLDQVVYRGPLALTLSHESVQSTYASGTHCIYIISLFLFMNAQLHGRDRGAQGPSSTETVFLCKQVCKVYNFKHAYSIAYICRIFSSLNHKVILCLAEIMNHKRCH